MELLYDPAFTPRYIPMRNENIDPHKNLHVYVHNRIVHNSQKVETIQISINSQWINKMQYIHTMKYHSAIKRNRILTYTTMGEH